jgi:hypothetical protein
LIVYFVVSASRFININTQRLTKPR